LFDDAFLPVVGLYGIFVARPVLSGSSRQQTQLGRVASSLGKLCVFIITTSNSLILFI